MDSTALKKKVTAWEAQRLLHRKYGSLLDDALYPWFSEAKCTLSYSSAGMFLLLQCEEAQALEVLYLAEQVLSKKTEVDWRKFVKSRDWDVHRTRNHPPEWIKKIWANMGAEL